MVEDLFRLLARPEVPWLLSAAIVVGAFLLWGAFRSRLAPVLAALDRAIAAVEETDGPASFRNRFQTVYRTLADNPVLGETWRAYATTLKPLPVGGDALGYTRRPREHFDDNLLLSAGFNLRFYQAVPNLLVGLGLLFTFVGLVAALHFASSGVAAEDVRIAQAALGDLLAAATFKFATSIAGLGSSLLFSWREKAQLHRAQSRLLRFCHALEARTVPITGETLALAQLDELRRQSAELQRLASVTHASLPAAAESEMRAEIRAAFEPLRHALATLAGRLAKGEEWLVEAVRGEPGGARQRRGGLTSPVESTITRGAVTEVLEELREIRCLLERSRTDERMPSAVRNRTAAPASREPGPALDRVQRRLSRLLGSLRAILPQLAELGRTRRSRPQLERIVRDLYARVQDALEAVHELRGQLGPAASGDAGADVETVLHRVEAGLVEATGRIEQVATDLEIGIGEREPGR